jgi:hypothetical protein
MSNRQVELAPHPKTRGLTLLVDDETALLKAYGVERGPTKQRDMRRLTAVCREFETQVIAWRLRFLVAASEWVQFDLPVSNWKEPFE